MKCAALVQRHRQSRGKRVRHSVDIQRIHNQRAIQFLRRARELR
jgi:hypothetical protein